jgi:hypothetical protein
MAAGNLVTSSNLSAANPSSIIGLLFMLTAHYSLPATLQ